MRATFDRFDHDILLQKFRGIRVVSNAQNWIKSLLKNRKIIVKILNYESYEFKALSGLPQVSHCGALLFLVMINYLISVIKYPEQPQ